MLKSKYLDTFSLFFPHKKTTPVRRLKKYQLFILWKENRLRTLFCYYDMSY
nr:MAG TPA: hypothetical protein [Caudoviricetes sp.]